MRSYVKRGFLALNLFALTALSSSEAMARTDVLRWMAGADAGSPITGFVVYSGSRSRQYTFNLDVGLGTPDANDIYTWQVDVPDTANAYYAVKSYDALGRYSKYSNEIIRHPSTATVMSEVFGSAGDTPIVGDWDGDGDSDIGYVRAESDGLHFHFLNRDNPASSPPSVVIGTQSDYPVVGNWRFNGKDLPGVIRCAGADCDCYASLPTTPPGVLSHEEFEVLGLPVVMHQTHPVEGFPISVEYLGGALDFYYPDFSVSRGYRITVGSGLSPQAMPLLGSWQVSSADLPGFADAYGNELIFFMQNTSPTDLQSIAFGQAGIDTAISGDWDGDGFTDIGVVRRLEGKLIFLLSMAPYRCPNGLIEPGEWCDDGNAVDGDGCSSMCTLETSDPSLDTDGDGVLDFDDNCPLDANPLQQNADLDGRGDICDAQSCGNGIVEPGELCDDANRNSGDGCSSSCASESCGDGVLQTGLGESCDDGNLVSGDGCSDACSSEVAIIPGDANRDGLVDGVDFSIWAGSLGMNVTPGAGADFNADGTIDASDYDVWLLHYGEVVP